MHEMSLAEGMLLTLENYAREHGVRKIHGIHLQIGIFSGIEAESLKFCFEMIAAGSIAEGAQVEVESIPAMGVCHACGKSTTVTEPLMSCPHCESQCLQLSGGSDWAISALEVSDV